MYYIGPIIAVAINRNINKIQNYFDPPKKLKFHCQTKCLNKSLSYSKIFDFKLKHN
jgi:hypothetical protein